MRINSGASSLQQFQAAQRLQAQQAFRPRSRPQETDTEPTRFPLAETSSPATHILPANQPRLRLPINEIQHIAKQAGFIDLPPSDIEQAYLNGSSLLADYRV